MTLFAEPRPVTKLEDCLFYHTMDLPEFGVVEGHWDLRENFDQYVGGVELGGKTVLDVGCSSGFLSFEAEKRGASVVSFDVADASSESRLPFKDKLYHQNHHEWVVRTNKGYEPIRNGYWLAHRLYRSRAKVHYGNIYRLPESLGRFDVVLVGSVVEHLSDPVSALASISRLTGDSLVINTTLLDTDDEIAMFEPSANDPEHDFTWWVYSRGIYQEVLAMLGFGIESISWNLFLHVRDKVRQPRAAIVARRLQAGSGSAGAEARTRKSRRYRSSQEEIIRLTAELAQARGRLATLEDLGPTTIGLARRWRRLADKYPQAFALFKPVGSALLRLLG